MKVISTILAAASLASLSSAHMEMKSPPALRSSFNPNTGDNVDYDIRSPLNSDGSDFPCKGDLGLLSTPAGRPVATWAPGGTYSFVIHGNTPHDGGSCQASLSFDGGRTFKVVHSYVGNCPVDGDSSYQFTLPGDTPAGQALFAWSWFNNEGNREMYMNCAVVTIAGGRTRRDAAPLAGRPDMFVANVGNGVCTYEGTDLEFPQPGPDVTRNTQRPHAPGRGTCDIWGGGDDQ
ncbi:extracellular protein [Cordyceps militaris]|uniref:Extracellular protein n=1 Tax=Cordyceps militaris TaxID=73501 RepID=A0A2H4SK94_CORMI|nr:extracellular protein [Cordyceps militaris]